MVSCDRKEVLPICVLFENGYDKRKIAFLFFTYIDLSLKLNRKKINHLLVLIILYAKN